MLNLHLFFNTKKEQVIGNIWFLFSIILIDIVRFFVEGDPIKISK